MLKLSRRMLRWYAKWNNFHVRDSIFINIFFCYVVQVYELEYTRCMTWKISSFHAVPMKVVFFPVLEMVARRSSDDKSLSTQTRFFSKLISKLFIPKNRIKIGLQLKQRLNIQLLTEGHQNVYHYLVLKTTAQLINASICSMLEG